MSTAPAALASSRVQSFPRLLLALVTASVPACVALYATVVSRDRSDEAPVFFIVILAPVLFYLVAFTVCLPEALGLRTKDLPTLLERWRQFSRWASIIPPALIVLLWSFVALYAAFSRETIPHPLIVLSLLAHLGRLALILAMGWLASAIAATAPFAGEAFLSGLRGVVESPSATGWRARLFSWNSRWGPCFLNLCSSRLALLFGSVAILISLILPMEADSSWFESSGYSVLVGRMTLPTVTYTVKSFAARPIVARAEQAMYLLALLAAFVALFSFVLGKRGVALRQYTTLRFLSAVVALFATTDLALSFARLFTTEDIFGGQSDSQAIVEKFFLVLWLILFGSIVALWLKASHSRDDAANRLRILAMILLLPPLLFALVFLPFLTVLSPGIAATWIGSYLLMCGLVRFDPSPTAVDI